MSGVIDWDRKKLKRLKAAVKRADDIVLKFDGHDIAVPYARYLIEYLERVLK